MACECDTQAPSSLTRQQRHEKAPSSSSSSSSSSSLLLLSPKRSLFFHMDAPLSPPRPSAARNPLSCGLAAVLVEAESRGRVLLGMRRLRVLQLPPAIEFGVKNRDSRLALLSPVQRSPAARAARSEAEEEYTCVIARGPNPRMTHIFDDRAVVQSCDDRLGQGDHAPFLQHRGESEFVGNQCSYPEVFFDKGIRDTPDGEKLKA